jgi:hypothetical protein
MSDICKSETCDFVFPIKETECIGDSLIPINFNFISLGVKACETQTHIATAWNPVYNVFSQLSSDLLQTLSLVEQNSACWTQTYTTVSQFSSFWLKPITLIYPFVFAVGQTDIAQITRWLNENFSAKNNSCFNYIVGQELFIHSAEYHNIIRTQSETAVASFNGGVRSVRFDYNCFCISTYTSHTEYKNVDCGSQVQYQTLTVSIPDNYTSFIRGLKYVLTNAFEWVYVGQL